MNDDPAETPNPLNPAGKEELISEPDSMPENTATRSTGSVVDGFIRSSHRAPSTPTITGEPATTEEPTMQDEPTLREPMMGDETVVAEEAVTIEEPIQDTVSSEPTVSPDPLNRPMEKAPEPEVKPVKKKRTGLIVGSIICILLAIGCIVAAVLIFMNHKNEDVVAKAVEKLFSDKAPSNVSIDGTISLDVTDNNSAFSKIDVELKSDLIIKSMINSTEADINATLRGGSDQTSLKLNEIYAPSGDLYIKIDGLVNVIDDMNTRNAILNSGEETLGETVVESTDSAVSSETVVDSTGNTATITSAFESIDGEWLRTSAEEFGAVGQSLVQNNNAMCLVNLANNAADNANSIKRLYEKNPFLVTSEDKLVIESKQNPVYKVAINNTNLTNFVNSANNSTALDDFYDCMGYENASIDANDLMDGLKKLPEIYVEIDKDYNFTRVFFEASSNDGSKATVDLGLSYPTNINVSEPGEYQDFSAILQNLFSAPQIEEETVEVEVQD